jgi:hypothetical protein
MLTFDVALGVSVLFASRRSRGSVTDPYLRGGYIIERATIMLRTDALSLLLLQRLHALGPCSEQEAVDVLDDRSPGRGHEVITWSEQRGLIRRIEGTGDEPAMLEAASAPHRHLAA